jgi:hypothetical protein
MGIFRAKALEKISNCEGEMRPGKLKRVVGVGEITYQV